MSKLFANFKKMSIIKKIASIAFLAAFAVAFIALFIDLIDNFFISKLFLSAFSGINNFFNVTSYVISQCLMLIFYAALVVAMFSGSGRNIAFVLLTRAIIIAADLTFESPFLRMVSIIPNGFAASIPASTAILSGIMRYLMIAVLICLSILVMGGFGKHSAVAGFSITAVLSIYFITDIVYIIQDLISGIEAFIKEKDVFEGLYYILVECGLDLASMIFLCGMTALALSVVFVGKGAKKQVKIEGTV